MSPSLKEIDSPVQMRLYGLTKHRFVMVFTCFCVSFFVVLMIGILGPEAIGEASITAKELNVPSKKYITGPYTINSGLVSRFNQEVWLFCEFKLGPLPVKDDYKLEREFHMSTKVLGSEKDTSHKLINRAYQNRSRTLKCNKDSCDSLVVFHLGKLTHPSYIVEVTFYGLSFPQGVKVRNVVFTFRYYQEQFTQIQIWFRFVFLVLAFTVTCLFTHSLRRFPVRDWCIEQKWMSVLLPLLLLYDNPLFPLGFLVQSWIPSMLDVIFQGTFFSALLVFWLCAYHGIRQNNRRFVSFYLPKLLLVAAIWITGCALASWQEFHELGDPSYQYKVDSGHFMGLTVFFFVLGALYVIYLIILLVQAFQDLKNMPYFDVRLKFLTILMLMVVLISLIAMFIRFGSTILEDNFVMDISSRYKNSAEFLAFYGLFNLYLYTMAYMYSPLPSYSADNHRLKAVPSSFSVIADSDDKAILHQKNDVKNAFTNLDEYTSEEENNTTR